MESKEERFEGGKDVSRECAHGVQCPEPSGLKKTNERGNDNVACDELAESRWTTNVAIWLIRCV